MQQIGNWKQKNQSHIYGPASHMELLARGIAIGMGLETLSCNEVIPINYEQTLFQALVNEGRVCTRCGF